MNIEFKQSLGILFLSTTFLFLSCSTDKKEKDMDLEMDKAIAVQVTTASLLSTEKMTVSGQIESEETAVISTRVMGFISSIKVKPGDKVQKGELLATINNADILAKRAQAQAMISEAEAALKDAQKDYERFKDLHLQQSASTKELENAALHYNAVKAKAEAAHQMKNEVDAMLAYTNLVAPFSGVITQKHTDEGSMANPGMPILTMEQPMGYHVRAFVSENEVGKLFSGMTAEVMIKSSGRVVSGKITEISPSAQFTGGQFQIKVMLPPTENTGLFSGMYVNVSVPLKTTLATQGLFVPASVIVHKDQLAGLYTVSKNSTAQLRWIKPGKEHGGKVEVLSGLRADEIFIMQSDGRLYNGVSVSVK